jgi:hypothetical protein
MRIRFQADADFNQIIVKAVLRREPAIDFKTAPAANLAGLQDPEVLTLAAGEQRILITHDRKTMPTHFAEFIQTETSWGVLIVPQTLPIRLAAEELLLIWLATEAEEWINRIRSLPL